MRLEAITKKRRDMIKKIIAIKNIGRFRDSAAGGDTQLKKRTYVVGPNGFGKTTLCAILRALGTGDATHIEGRKTLGVADAPSVNLLMDSGPMRFSGGAWSGTFENIAVFDSQFVAENVHSGDVVDIEHRRNLYRVIIGEDGVRLAVEDTALAAGSRAKTGEISLAARALRPHMPEGMNVEAFMALAAVDDIDGKIDEQEKAVAAIREADAIRQRPAFSEYPKAKLDAGFVDLLSKTIDGVSRDAEDKLARHLETHRMVERGAEWIAFGVEHIEDDACPFCRQDVRDRQLVAAYRAIFGEGYRSLKSDIDATQHRVAAGFGEVAVAQLVAIEQRNAGALEFWSRYCSFDGDSVALGPASSGSLVRLGRKALELLEKKAQAPLEAIATDDDFAAALAASQVVEADIDRVNASIRAANILIEAKRAEAVGGDLQAELSELARLNTTKARHSAALAPLCEGYGRVVVEKAEIDTRREDVRNRLNEHTRTVVEPYERRINQLLSDFNAGFTIRRTTHSFPGGIATSSYQLVINDIEVDIGDSRTPIDRPSFKNTLSAGDRTTLALAFFIANLERNRTLSAAIVVFDDPFNSQDAFRRRQTVQEISKLAGNCAQTIVLSHDATFLKQLWDKAPTDERASLALVDQRALGTKIMPIDLHEACQGRTTADIGDLQTFVSVGTGRPLDVMRKMRAVLETFCITTFPTSFSLVDWLGDIVRRIREGGDGHPARFLYDELDQINAYTAPYHHGENLADVTPDQIDHTELIGFARRTLRIVNALQA